MSLLQLVEDLGHVGLDHQPMFGQPPLKLTSDGSMRSREADMSYSSAIYHLDAGIRELTSYMV
jgi:hypothetical protein